MQRCSVEHIAGKPPIPHSGLLKHVAEASVDTHTRTRTQTQMNLIFIYMTSEHAQQKATEVAFSGPQNKGEMTSAEMPIDDDT